MRIYLAGPLFTEAERAFSLELAHLLEKEGHEVYLPQHENPAASGPGRTATIFRANLPVRPTISNARAAAAVRVSTRSHPARSDSC